MELKRCKNGHYYDPSKHSSCPHCGINIDLDLPPLNDIPKTMPKLPEQGNPGQSTVAKGRSGPEGKTIGIMNKSLGIDPVVGWLVCVDGKERGRDYRIRSEKNFIGRSEKMDICIASDETISRENHAIISFNPKNCTFKIYPGDSRGLVYLNDEEVDIPRELNAYDRIELGQTRVIFIPLCGECFKWE